MSPFEEARARLVNLRETQATRWEELERTITELERIVGRTVMELDAAISRCTRLEAELVPGDDGHICEPLIDLQTAIFEAREGGVRHLTPKSPTISGFATEHGEPEGGSDA